MSSSYLLIGLGNPGREFSESRHNVGFMLVDALSTRLEASRPRLQAAALVCTASLDGRKVILAKPQTFMNASGRSVQGLLNYYKVPLEHLLVAHDDLDLPFGVLRLRPGGGPGGQKGMASAIDYLGTREFPRLRIGIGRPPGRMDPADYVLKAFSAEQRSELAAILERAAEAALTFVRGGLDQAMNRFNADVQTT